MLSANKEVFARAHIDQWQEAGYGGQGLRIAVLDMEGKLYPYQQNSVTYPLGPFGKAGKHLGQCCAVLEQILPKAELFALPTSREAWEWVLVQKPDLVSCSYCGPKLPEDVAAKLERSGIVVCAAAGKQRYRGWGGQALSLRLSLDHISRSLFSQYRPCAAVFQRRNDVGLRRLRPYRRLKHATRNP